MPTNGSKYFRLTRKQTIDLGVWLTNNVAKFDNLTQRDVAKMATKELEFQEPLTVKHIAGLCRDLDITWTRPTIRRTGPSHHAVTPRVDKLEAIVAKLQQDCEAMQTLAADLERRLASIEPRQSRLTSIQ